MHGNITTLPDDAAIDLSRVDWEIGIIGDPAPERITHYRLTCVDGETGIFISSMVVPAGPGGQPPTITVGDIVGLIGLYRFASVYVEIEAERLARLNRRVSDRRRSRTRGWLKTIARSVLAEHGICPGARS